MSTRTIETVLARFEAERQAIALMDHPQIAKLLDADDARGYTLFRHGAGQRDSLMNSAINIGWRKTGSTVRPDL